jgi:hypothetical protein
MGESRVLREACGECVGSTTAVSRETAEPKEWRGKEEHETSKRIEKEQRAWKMANWWTPWQEIAPLFAFIPSLSRFCLYAETTILPHIIQSHYENCFA